MLIVILLHAPPEKGNAIKFCSYKTFVQFVHVSVINLALSVADSVIGHVSPFDRPRY